VELTCRQYSFGPMDCQPGVWSPMCKVNVILLTGMFQSPDQRRTQQHPIPLMPNRPRASRSSPAATWDIPPSKTMTLSFHNCTEVACTTGTPWGTECSFQFEKQKRGLCGLVYSRRKFGFTAVSSGTWGGMTPPPPPSPHSGAELILFISGPGHTISVGVL
jgi:hypothetical protein